MEEVRNYSDTQFQEFVHEQIDSIKDFELLILKSHIILEFVINCYLESLSNKHEADFFNERLTFDTKIKVLSHFGNISENNDKIIKSLRVLNNIRNGIAHKLNVNKQLVKEFLFLVMNISDDKNFYEKDDSIYEKYLFAFGFLSGILFSNYTISKIRKLNS